MEKVSYSKRPEGFAGIPVKPLIKARALYVGNRMHLRSLETAGRLATGPLTLPVGDGGCAVLFRYGAVVLYDVLPLDEVHFLEKIRPLLSQPFDSPIMDEVNVAVVPDGREGVENGGIILKEVTVERLQLIADVLAKSLVLEHYETKVSGIFDRIEPLAGNLEKTGHWLHSGRELLRHIGGSLLSLHKMVGRVEVSEKPEILWENPSLERLFARLIDEYEITERHLALERKLDLISRTAQTGLNLLQAKRSLRVEWYIVILIMVEIALTLYELFTHKLAGP